MTRYENYKQDHYQFLQALKRAVSASGLTPAEICRRTGIDHGYYSRVINQTPEDCYKGFTALAICAIMKEIGCVLLPIMTGNGPAT